MNLITISNVSIRQFDNLYNLNDFHRASGGENRHRPSFWLQNQQALDLINELNLENTSVGNPTVPVIKVINGGKNRGTYVCKELIYAYATWVSAKFFLQVIRTFDSVVSGSLKLEPAQAALPVPMPQLNDELVLSIGRLLLHAQDMRLFVNRYLPAFECLGITNHGALWSYVHDTEPTFERVREFFLQQTPYQNHHLFSDDANWVRRQIMATAKI